MQVQKGEEVTHAGRVLAWQRRDSLFMVYGTAVLSRLGRVPSGAAVALLWRFCSRLSLPVLMRGVQERRARLSNKRANCLRPTSTLMSIHFLPGIVRTLASKCCG